LGLALDEPKSDDQVFENDSLKFLVETGLLATTGGITVDYIDAGPRSGFGITTVKPISTGGGCSSGSCGSGSCG
jgi:iron-sulfur cluster assembly protein